MLRCETRILGLYLLRGFSPLTQGSTQLCCAVSPPTEGLSSEDVLTEVAGTLPEGTRQASWRSEVTSLLLKVCWVAGIFRRVP